MFGLILITVILIALLVTGMSIGYILQGRCLRGSCGGPDVLGPDGESLACATCPLRKIREQAEKNQRHSDRQTDESQAA